MGVINTLKVVVSPLYASLELGHDVAVSRNAENSFGFGATECEDPVGEEREDDWDFEVWIGPLLQANDSVDGFTKSGWVEGCVL